MPILISTADDAPLTQGDILRDLSLFETDTTWEKSGGEPRKLKASLCMVLSRPCVALHKERIVVVPIERVKEGVPGAVDSFEKIRQFLEQLRDGFGQPDRFYLGHEIPGVDAGGRFFARLDSLHTIRVLTTAFGQDLVRAHRVATLHPDFRRDLHRRVFDAFASLGFDDDTWYSDQDLEWLIAAGRREVAAIEAQIAEKEAEIAKNASSGLDERSPTIAAQVGKLKTQADSLSETLSRCEQERDRRAKP